MNEFVVKGLTANTIWYPSTNTSNTRIIFDPISNDDFGNCGGYIP